MSEFSRHRRLPSVRKVLPEDIGIGRWRLGRLINITTVRQPVADIIGTVIDLIISVVEEPSRAAPPAKRLFGERLDHASIRLFKLGLIPKLADHDR